MRARSAIKHSLVFLLSTKTDLASFLNHDPNYNPDFTRHLYTFKLAWPPYPVN